MVLPIRHLQIGSCVFLRAPHCSFVDCNFFKTSEFSDSQLVDLQIAKVWGACLSILTDSTKYWDGLGLLLIIRVGD
jgi:hypothetical protein